MRSEKPGVVGAAADRRGEAALAEFICLFNHLRQDAIEDGLTIYAAAFAALYVKLASLDFKLDTFSSPHRTFGSPFHFPLDRPVLSAH